MVKRVPRTVSTRPPAGMEPGIKILMTTDHPDKNLVKLEGGMFNTAKARLCNVSCPTCLTFLITPPRV